MKKYFLLLFMACFWPFQGNIHASANCTSFAYRGKAYAPLFIPSEDDSIMNVRINLIFIQKDDGTGNFQEDNEEHQALLNSAMEILNNNIISSLEMPGEDCFSGSESEIVHDMRLRFIDHRHYIRNSRVWNNNLHTLDYNNLHADLDNWYLSSIDDSINSVLCDSLKGINIYFTEDSTIYHHFWEVQNISDTSNVWTGYSTDACSKFPSSTNLHMSSRIQMPCLYSKYWWMKNIVPQLVSEGNPTWLYEGWLNMAGSIASGLVHELGHSFNLRHPNDPSEYRNPYFSYPDTSCVATIMQPSGSRIRNFLPPNEIGLMYFSTMTTNLQQFVPCETYLGTKSFNTTVTLPRMRMYYSLTIGSSGNVSMPCDITFSSQSKIIIENGGVLNIDGAALQSIQNSWGGISVSSGGQLLLSDVSIGDYDIVVKSGGSLIIKEGFTLSGDHSILVEDGGYICITNSATINLVDEFSSIIISPNAILGCPSCTENCITTRPALVNSGDGHFVIYEGTEFVQDTTILSDYTATGNIVFAGYDVTTSKDYGNVVVENGGELRIKANEAILTNGVKVKTGGKLVISK